MGGEAAVSSVVEAQLAAPGRTVDACRSRREPLRHGGAGCRRDRSRGGRSRSDVHRSRRRVRGCARCRTGSVRERGAGPARQAGLGARRYTSDAITGLGLAEGVALGGTVAIADSTLATLDGLMTGTVERVYGRDRYDTAAAFADYAVEQRAGSLRACGHLHRRGLRRCAVRRRASRIRWWRHAAHRSPTILSSATAAALTDNRPAIDMVEVYGGTAAVSQDVRDEIAAILQ